jgi:glycosyltransferase involved in cell wall biosynthesis
MEEGISVIICCFNSSARLGPTMEHLYLQKNLLVSQWEIIVVDNASTDNTSTKAIEIWNSFVPPKPVLKVVYEPVAGLSSARNKGILESRYKLVLFCDDDNWLEESYIFNALNIMSLSPGIGALGGMGMPVFEKKEPPYFWENQYHLLAVGEQWPREGDITEERGVLYGAGMVLNKAAYNILVQQYHFQFQVSDRVADNLMSSGDHELCLALRLIGYKIFYSRSLRFKHFIPERRTCISYYKKLFLSFGKSDAMLFVYFVDKSNLDSIKNDYRYVCLRCCKNIIKTWMRLTFTGYYVGLNKYKYISTLQNLYNNLGILKRMLILRNSYKKTIRENPLFN